MADWIAGKRALPRSDGLAIDSEFCTRSLSCDGSLIPVPTEFAANRIEEAEPLGIELKACFAVSLATSKRLTAEF